MIPQRPTIRLNAEERAMVQNLLAAWRRDGHAINVTDVIRRCIREAENKRRRSSKLPPLPPIPGDTGGEVRRGRPRKQAVATAA